MDQQQALIAESHLKVLRLRISSFEAEMEAAREESAELDKELKTYEAQRDFMKEESTLRRNELEIEYSKQIEDYNRQIRINAEVLEKEKEKKKSFLSYLKELDICKSYNEDVKDFDWSSLQKMVSSSRQTTGAIQEQSRKAAILKQLTEQAKGQANDINQLLNSTISSHNKTINKLCELRSFAQDWHKTVKEQEEKITKLRDENYRLNLLIKQCVQVNEPMSKHITENVRAKCHSFMNSKTVEELVNGLLKYKSRQDRMIKLLRHKNNTLARDINLLTVTTDRTSDQLQYYLSIIRRNKTIERAVAGEQEMIINSQ